MTDSKTQTRVLRLCLTDRHAAQLHAMSRDVNLVWNYCNELLAKVFERKRRFIGAYDRHKYLAGASKEELSVGSAVFKEVADEFARRRKQFKRIKLRWRVSRGARRSLGWAPFKARALLQGRPGGVPGVQAGPVGQLRSGRL